MTSPKPKAELRAESEVLYITWPRWESHPNLEQRAFPLSALFPTRKIKAVLFPSLSEVGQVTPATGLKPPDRKCR